MQALKLNPSIRAIIKCLQPWHQLQSLTLSNALTQRDVAAVGKLTQLQSRIMGGEGLGEVIDVGCLSTGEVAKPFPQLHDADWPAPASAGMQWPHPAQACVREFTIPTPGPAQPLPSLPSCSWPSLAKLDIHFLGTWVVSTVLPTPQAVPKLDRLSASRGTETR